MKKENNILDQIGNKNPFSVPENYFEKFNQTIIEKVSKEKTVSIGFYQKMTPYLYLAAMFAIALFIGNLLLNKTVPEKTIVSQEKTKEQNKKDDVLLSYIDENTLIEYLVDNDEIN